MLNAKSRDERINRPHLDARTPAMAAKVSGLDIVVSIGNQHRQRGKFLEKFLAGLRTCKALQQFLEDESCCDDDLAAVKCGT